MVCKCQMCGREYIMPIDNNLMARLPDAYNFCSDACLNGFKTMRNGGVTPKQQKYNNVEEKLGKVLKIGFGTESEESGVKRMQQRYQLKQHKKIR